ncbi:RlpA-like double-psi beta-barrel domain-containing protein [Streptomyces sp. NPDC001389]|uniref:RlpA-like double-psi beta-barrel domain-containing protein n=1 Tax=unclassified Streptomyces TaxID=2593676 RepID=UPI0036B98E6B
MAALLATGPAAVITAATASASEDTGTAISAVSTSEQQGEAASSETDLPLSVRAPEPGRTTAPPPEPGITTAVPPEPGKTTRPPKPKPGKTTAAPPKPKPKPGKTTAAPPQPGKTTPVPAKPKPKPKPGESYEGTADFFSSNGLAGACGRAFNDHDFVAALDSSMFGAGSPAPHCGRKVIVTYKGKSIVATVLDASPTAQRRGLDLTPAAFTALAPLDQGTINVTWRFAE